MLLVKVRDIITSAGKVKLLEHRMDHARTGYHILAAVKRKKSDASSGGQQRQSATKMLPGERTSNQRTQRTRSRPCHYAPVIKLHTSWLTRGSKNSMVGVISLPLS